jgi:hypothetical protein
MALWGHDSRQQKQSMQLERSMSGKPVCSFFLMAFFGQIPAQMPHLAHSRFLICGRSLKSRGVNQKNHSGINRRYRATDGFILTDRNREKPLPVHSILDSSICPSLLSAASRIMGTAEGEIRNAMQATASRATASRLPSNAPTGIGRP